MTSGVLVWVDAGVGVLAVDVVDAEKVALPGLEKEGEPTWFVR